MESVVLKELLSVIDSSDLGVSRSNCKGFANIAYGTDGRVHTSDIQDRCDAFNTLIQRTEQVSLRAVEFQFRSRYDLSADFVLQPMNTNVIRQGRGSWFIRCTEERSTKGTDRLAEKAQPVPT